MRLFGSSETAEESDGGGAGVAVFAVLMVWEGRADAAP